MNQAVQSNNGMEKFNQLLQTQINDLLIKGGIEPDKLMPFLNAVNESYRNQQAQIEEQEFKFKLLIDNSYDMVTIHNIDGTIVYESPSFYRIFGYTPEEIIGSNGFELTHPEDFDATASAIRKACESPGTVHSTELRLKKKDGGYLWLEAVGSYVEEPGFSGIIINSRDITERKRSERQMATQGHLLETITRSMPVLVYKVNSDGICTDIKGNALKRIGKEEKEFIGVSVYDHFKDRAEDIEKAFSGEIVNFINKTNNRQEDLFFEHFLFLDETNNDKNLVGFAMDVTEGKQSQDRLADYYDTLEKTNKELDQFAYIVSHDLKAPLRAISNLSIWIEEDLEDKITEDSRGNFTLMRSRVVRMEQLINGILEYSRAGRMQSNPSQFNITTMVTETVNDLAPPAAFAVEIQPDMPEITADRIKVEQVFSNFISNAIKYNSNPNPTLRIGYTEEADQHVFYVADNGPGIDPEYHEKVFVIFQTLQARDKVESTGVGLAIVKKIIEDAGGKVWLESELGKGSTFFFSLPKMVAMAAA
jgi:PAS domain S-box-containing protein